MVSIKLISIEDYKR